MRDFHWLSGLAFLVSSAAALTHGCAMDAAREVHEVAVETAPLYASLDENVWSSNTINLCFQPFDQASYDDPNWASVTSHIRTTIESAYEAPPAIGLSLGSWGLCPRWNEFKVGNQSLATVEVLVWMNPPNDDYSATRYCDAGTPIAFPFGDECKRPTRTSHHVVLATSPEYWAFDTAILHEFAHVLGFSHEFTRDDWDGVCNPDGDDSGDNAGDIKLTPYDPDSILNGTYCGTPTELSELDKLGFEIAYPASTVHALAATGSFVLGDGTILARKTSIVTDEWTARGAHADALSVGTWTSEGNAAGSGDIKAATTLASSTPSYVVKAFTDYFGRAHAAEGDLVVNNKLHAAITHASLSVL